MYCAFLSLSLSLYGRNNPKIINNPYVITLCALHISNVKSVTTTTTVSPQSNFVAQRDALIVTKKKKKKKIQ